MSSSRALAKRRRQWDYYTFLQYELYRRAVGGPVECQRCGYGEFIAALHLHHPDPTVKMRKFNQRNWSPKDFNDPAFMRELKGCQLLCANCHAEHHAEEQYDALFGDD